MAHKWCFKYPNSPWKKKKFPYPALKHTKCPATREWIHELSYVHSVENYSAGKKNWIIYVCDGRDETWISETLLKESSQKQQNNKVSNGKTNLCWMKSEHWLLLEKRELISDKAQWSKTTGGQTSSPAVRFLNLLKQGRVIQDNPEESREVVVLCKVWVPNYPTKWNGNGDTYLIWETERREVNIPILQFKKIQTK